MGESTTLSTPAVDGYGWAIIPPVSSNLDLARSIYAPIEQGDYSKAEWADPEIEYVLADGLEPRTYTGLVGLAEAMRNLFSDIVDFRRGGGVHGVRWRPCSLADAMERARQEKWRAGDQTVR